MPSTKRNAVEEPQTAVRNIFTFRCAYKSDMPENYEGELYVAEYVGELFVPLDDDSDDEEHLAGEA